MSADDESPGAQPVVGVDARLARDGGLSYLHIPAVDVHAAAEFYETVFGWEVHGKDTNRPGFLDGTGHVRGAWVTNQEVSRTPGLLPYVYVDDIAGTITRIEAGGGAVVEAPSPEGNLLVATFRDPAGNVIGLWQEA